MLNSAFTKLSKSINWLVISLYLFVGALALINLIGTNALATQGIVLDDLLAKTDTLNRKNEILEVEINKLSNLSYIEKAATGLGFQKINNKIVINSEEAVASVFDRP